MKSGFTFYKKIDKAGTKGTRVIGPINKKHVKCVNLTGIFVNKLTRLGICGLFTK